ncbi:MAG: hypothetical protein ABRQ38_16455 [Candidatus Eremiobacterota bacterium]
MGNCECLERCPFFNNKMPDRPATAELMKKKYCQGDNSQCARYIIFKKLGSSKVPIDLYPSQLDKAKIILKGG